MITVREEPAAMLAAHARIAIAFEVHEVLACVPDDGGLGGLRLERRVLPVPYVKDYDVDAGAGPERWAERFDVTRWGFLGAFLDGERIGGAVIAHDTPGVEMLAGRRDLAVLWDLRVAPDRRRRGVGRALFEAAERWAASRGCRTLEVETQNVNVPACRFYRARGCVLGGIARFAYPALPDEVQLLWYRSLGA